MNALAIRIMEFILGYAGKKLDGKKTYAGAAGKILTGVGTLLGGLVAIIGMAFPDQGIPTVSLEVAITMLTGGFYMISSGIQGIGLGHKGEKAIEAAAASVPVEQLEAAVRVAVQAQTAKAQTAAPTVSDGEYNANAPADN